MIIGAPREINSGEMRVAMTPDSALQLRKLGYSCVIETEAGLAAGFSDDAYRAVGVQVLPSAAALWEASNVVVKVRAPEADEVARIKRGDTLISFFQPAQNKDLLELCRERGGNIVAMDCSPSAPVRQISGFHEGRISGSS